MGINVSEDTPLPLAAFVIPNGFTGAAIQSALDTGNNVQLKKGTYVISTGLTMSEGQTLKGEGYNTILSTSANISILSLHDNCTVEKIKFLGSLNYTTKDTTGITSQHGIELPNRYGSNITKCWFNNLGGNGVYGNLLNTSGAQYIGNIISKCVMKNNNYGALLLNGTEYYELNDVRACYNIYGLKIGGGNNRVNGGSYSGNWKHGIWVTGTDGNDSHSTISGAAINHNNAEALAAGTNFGIFLDDIDLGYTINSCALYSNDISITGSKGVVFNGCQMNVSIMKAGGSQALFAGCSFLTTRPSIQDNTSSLGYSDIKYSNFRTIADALPITTTNGTATTVYTYTMMNVTNVMLEVEIIAGSGNYVGIQCKRIIKAIKNTGSVTIQQTDIIGTDYIEASLTAAGVPANPLTITGTATGIQINVTGAAATTIRWKATATNESYTQ